MTKHLIISNLMDLGNRSMCRWIDFWNLSDKPDWDGFPKGATSRWHFANLQTNAFLIFHNPGKRSCQVATIPFFVLPLLFHQMWVSEGAISKCIEQLCKWIVHPTVFTPSVNLISGNSPTLGNTSLIFLILRCWQFLKIILIVWIPINQRQV